MVRSVSSICDCVATYAPMKRGLKAISISCSDITWWCSNLCPDEKGTESEQIVEDEDAINM